MLPFFFRKPKLTQVATKSKCFECDNILLIKSFFTGDFLCISLINGSVQLSHSLGDRTTILGTLPEVTINGNAWHVIKEGGASAAGYLHLDGMATQEKPLQKRAPWTHTRTSTLME